MTPHKNHGLSQIRTIVHYLIWHVANKVIIYPQAPNSQDHLTKIPSQYGGRPLFDQWSFCLMSRSIIISLSSQQHGVNIYEHVEGHGLHRPSTGMHTITRLGQKDGVAPVFITNKNSSNKKCFKIKSRRRASLYIITNQNSLSMKCFKSRCRSSIYNQLKQVEYEMFQNQIMSLSNFHVMKPYK